MVCSLTAISWTNCHKGVHRTHLGLSHLTLSLHVLEAASLSAQLSFYMIQLLLTGRQLNPAGLDTDPQGIQLGALISHLPLETVMLAASAVQQALQLPDLTLCSRSYMCVMSGAVRMAPKAWVLACSAWLHASQQHDIWLEEASD